MGSKKVEWRKGLSNVQGSELSLRDPGCYLYATEKDTVYLKLNSVENRRAIGDLNYNLNERDGSIGFIEGEIHGDTLIANYTFLSEGLVSVREVGFLQSKEQVTEGYGDMEEVDGEIVFLHKDSLDFSNGMIMPRVPCDQIALVDYEQYFSDSLLDQRK